MDSIIDYVKWMGDFPIGVKEFCEVDAIVLSALSYIDFTDGLAGRKTMLLKDYEGDPFDAKVCLTSYIHENRELLEAAIASRRFGEMEIAHYVQIYRPEEPLQFAAVTYRQEGFAFVAFRGTDSTLTGWREDFMLTFTRSNAQEEARKYLNKILREEKSLYIGGHSKGGNHAIYAACMLSDEKLKKIKRIYCLDGPGFCAEVLDPGLLDRIDAISVRIMPRFCVVGKLFEPKLTDAHIVTSSASGAAQHSLCSWGIRYGKLDEARSFERNATRMASLFVEWIEGTPIEERERVINETFDTLEAAGIRDLSELKNVKMETLGELAGRFRALSGESKKFLTALPKAAIRGELEEGKKSIETTWESLWKNTALPGPAKRSKKLKGGPEKHARRELWDAYDRKGNRIPGDLVRGEEIPDGVYHICVEIMVQHRDGSLLVMQRDMNKEVGGGLLEVSAGGALQKGETPLEGILRELREETGITDAEPIYQFTEVSEVYPCIFMTYFCVTGCDKEAITLQEGETISYRWLAPEDVLEGLRKHPEQFIHQKRLMRYPFWEQFAEN